MTEPNKKAFKKFTTYNFEELTNMDLGTRDGCYHFYHQESDNIYSWDFVNGTPHWTKQGSEKDFLKQTWVNKLKRIPHQERFYKFSGYDFDSLLKMNIYEHNMTYFYHGPSDTVYTWNYETKPHWVKKGPNTSKLLKQKMNNLN